MTVAAAAGRAGHVAVLLTGGRVLLASGQHWTQTYGPDPTADLYPP